MQAHWTIFDDTHGTHLAIGSGDVDGHNAEVVAFLAAAEATNDASGTGCKEFTIMISVTNDS